ncbi:hypothetical protein M9H77_08689 [Catharanthus roseus]|uniref:Uncharacterized protein n=1 Tax=Catharanthus roseus TaxID=4058 RepID=A0ACC0BYP8_CATRO|nr:hypothetical protein M9H77_08689 [Catharanthus roseus]
MYGARRHIRRSGRRHIRTDCRGIVARGPASTAVVLGLSLSGRRRWASPSHSRTCMSYCISRRDSWSLIGKYQELKADAERLHIETGSPISTKKQLMFEVAATRAMSMVSSLLQSTGEAAATRH